MPLGQCSDGKLHSIFGKVRLVTKEKQRIFEDVHLRKRLYETTIPIFELSAKRIHTGASLRSARTI